MHIFYLFSIHYQSTFRHLKGHWSLKSIAIINHTPEDTEWSQKKIPYYLP